MLLGPVAPAIGRRGDSVSARTRDRLQRSERPVLKKPFNLEELREMLDRMAG